MALLLHPGDREPSSLELAILRGQHIWGSDFNSKCYRSTAAFHPLTASDNTQQVLGCSRNSGHFPDTRCKQQQTSVLCSIPLARVPTERESPQPPEEGCAAQEGHQEWSCFLLWESQRTNKVKRRALILLGTAGMMQHRWLFTPVLVLRWPLHSGMAQILNKSMPVCLNKQQTSGAPKKCQTQIQRKPVAKFLPSYDLALSISWNKLCIFFSMGCTDRYKLCSGKCVENKVLPCAQHPNVWDSGVCTLTVSHHTGQIRGIILSRDVTHHHEGGAREELEWPSSASCQGASAATLEPEFHRATEETSVVQSQSPGPVYFLSHHLY